MKVKDKTVKRRLKRELKKEDLTNESIGKEKIENSEVNKYILRYFLMEWKMIVISQIILFFQTYLNIQQPFFTQNFIEAAISHETETLIELVKLYAIQNLFLIVSEPLLGVFINQFKKRLQVRIQKDIFKEILSKDIQYFEQTKFVTIQQLASQGSRAVMDLACGDRVFTQLKMIFKAGGHCYFLFYKSKLIAFILLAFCLLRGIWNHFSLQWKMLLTKQNYKDVLVKENAFADIIQNVMTVKAFARESKEIKMYEDQLINLQQAENKIDFLNFQVSTVSDFLSKLQKIIVLYYGSIYFIMNQEIVKVSTITTLLQYSYSFTQLYTAIKELFCIDEHNMYLQVESVVNLTHLKANQGLSEHIFIDVSSGNSTGLNAEREELSSLVNNSRKIKGEIRFENACFKYHDTHEEYLVKNVSFLVKEGEFVAFAGTSGSGKSTMVKLIERFYDLNEGTVYIDGTNVKDLSLGLLRTSIGLVSQEPVLFDTTILQNITYGVDQYDEHCVREVCDISGVSEFVFDKERFPYGLDTVVGSKGLLLSGGQKQRVAIARALIKRPRILIFDEATSSLDSESEFQVQQYIDLLVKKRGMTIVVIAHRLSTIVNCDRIYLMQKGEIIESGSHKELLELNGFYKHLINRQLCNEDNSSLLSQEQIDSPTKKNDSNTETIEKSYNNVHSYQIEKLNPSSGIETPEFISLNSKNIQLKCNKNEEISQTFSLQGLLPEQIASLSAKIKQLIIDERLNFPLVESC